MKKERNAYIDIVKAITIILVVLGHCIQYGSGSEFLTSTAFFKNKVFIFIYSFHMPLFMLMSGYLFAFSTKKSDKLCDAKTIIIKKAKQLIVPLFFWSFISFGIEIYNHIIEGCIEEITFWWSVKKLVYYFICGPWFLWAIWWCSLAVIIVKFLFKDNLFIYIIGLVITFIIPDGYGLDTYKFMYPFFVLGYWFNAHNVEMKMKKVYLNVRFVIGIIVAFVIMLFFYDHDSYIYTSGYTLIGKHILYQLWNDYFRFVIGLFGSLSVMYSIYGLYKLNHKKYPVWLCYIGTQTLGIYLISNVLVGKVLPRITSGIIGINYLIIIGETIVILVLSLAINWLLKRKSIINTMFLGGR